MSLPKPTLQIANLPNELILSIAENLDQNDLSAFLRCNRRLAFILEPLLLKFVLSPKEDVPALFYAVVKKNIVLIEYILRKGVDIDVNMLVPRWDKRVRNIFNSFTIGGDDVPIIQWALEGVQTEIIGILVEKGARIPRKGEISDLIRQLREETILRFLFDNGFPLPYTPLHHTVSWSADEFFNWDLEYVRGCLFSMYIEKGAYIEETNTYGDTPLNVAAHYRRDKLVAILLQHNANINTKNNDGYTPLHSAVLHLHDNEAKHVLFSNLPWAMDYAKNEKYTTILPRGTTFLERGTEIVLQLLDYGADISARTNDGKTPLHIAAISSRIETDITFLELLLQHGADIAAVDYYGNTPLHYAAGVGNSDAIRFLLLNGGYSNMLGYKGNTPFHCAAGDMSIPSMKLLLEYGADILARNVDGATPLHFAAEGQTGRGEGTLPRNYSGKRLTSSDFTAAIMFLLENGAKISSKDYQGDTPLEYAKMYNNTYIANLLLKLEALNEELFGSVYPAIYENYKA